MGKLALIPTGAKIKILLMFLGMMAGFGLVIYWLWPKGESVAKADEPTAIPVQIQTVAPLSSELPPSPTVPPETPDIARTATFQAAISRPAWQNNPAASPYYIGVITYESGCSVSNLGFTTSGIDGQPYYLYLREPLDRDPFMQIVQIQGFVQVFEDCPHPVIFIEQLFWFGDQGTPSPLSTPIISGTATVTRTVSTWGSFPTPKPTVNPIPVVSYPTYTPYPTATPYVPPPKVYPTYTPYPKPTKYPTYTPYPTPTPNPATATPTYTPTPQAITLYGPVVTVAGCPQTNFALNASGTNYYIILAGAVLPPGDPSRYFALASGQADVACGGQAIRAQSITWYDVTPTPTHTPTLTPTSTLTPTVEPTSEPTIEPTIEPTAESTTEPTTEPTNEPMGETL